MSETGCCTGICSACLEAVRSTIEDQFDPNSSLTLESGDYDGDRVQVYWHPDLVSGFRHADPNFATPPEAVNQCLEKNVESVESFLERVPDTAPWEYRIAELQRVLLVSLRNASIVGTCSNWWEKAVYKYGYDSNEAVRLAYL